MMIGINMALILGYDDALVNNCGFGLDRHRNDDGDGGDDYDDENKRDSQKET